MFKLESYVTPLLLSYVNKYIKNLKPEDSQVSLWGGDAVFNNLDLRTDILEQELSLPFTFVNGHIHELRIHVPWTKLGSEPIIITINTIECILKLKDEIGQETDASSSGSGASYKSKEAKKKVRRLELEEAPSNYVQSLISRIVNNISIVCNNLILKYVEDDIVLSLNVKSVQVTSANELWENAFVDLSLPELVLRKNIHLHDLTVCLDQRNGSGKIEIYQDPLLYRCSLEGRLYMAYDSAYGKVPAVTRLDVLCDKLEFSITDQQLPMFARLLQLCFALYFGELDGREADSSDNAKAADGDDDDDASATPRNDDDDDQNDVSWGSWAWSIIPQIIPDWEDEDETNENEAPKLPLSVLHFGIYIKSASFIFKLSESFEQTVAALGTQKLVCHPFACLYLEDIFCNGVIRHPDCANFQMGIQAVRLASLGDCVCRNPDAASISAGHVDPTFFVIGITTQCEDNNYLTGSLFSDDAPENKGQRKTYYYEWEEYFNENPEHKMFSCSGGFAADFFYFLEMPEEITDKASSINFGDLEYSNLKERFMIRVFLNKPELNISGALVHRWQKFLHCIGNRNYEPYARAMKDANIPSTPTDNDVADLEAFVPFRAWMVAMKGPVIRILPADHPAYNANESQSATMKKKKSRSYQRDGRVSSLLPVVLLTSSRFESYFECPMYPKRIIRTVTKLCSTSEVLMYHCHSHLTFKLSGFEVNLHSSTHEKVKVTILPACSGTYYIKELMLPDQWKNQFQPRTEHSVELSRVLVRVTWPQVLLIDAVYKSWCQRLPDHWLFESTSLVQDAMNTSKENCPSIEVLLTGFEWKYADSEIIYAHNCWIGALRISLHHTKQGSNKVITLVHGPEEKGNIHKMGFFKEPMSLSSVDFLLPQHRVFNFILQLPKNNIAHNTASAVLMLNVKGLVVMLDPMLYVWLSNVPTIFTNKPVRAAELNASIHEEEAESRSKVSLASSTPVTAQSETHTQSCSHNERNDGKKWISDFSDIFEFYIETYQLLRKLVIQVSWESCTLFLPLTSMKNDYCASSMIKSCHKAYSKGLLPDVIVVNLPQIKLHNEAQKQNISLENATIPITGIDGWSLGFGDNLFPWSLKLANCSIYTVFGSKEVETILLPTAISATFALTTKCIPPMSDKLSQLGLCVHADMDTLHASFSQRQVHLVNVIAKEIADAVKAQCLKRDQLGNDFASKTHSRLPSSSHLETLDVVTLPTISEDVKDQCVEKPNLTNTDNVKLSFWLQWTLPKFVLDLITSNDDGGIKVQCDLDELIVSIDVQEVYSKIKSKISSMNCFHYKRQNKKWIPGPFEGIIFSCTDKFSKAIQVQHSNTRNVVKSGLFEPGQSKPSDANEFGFLKMTITRAQCKSVHKRWNSMLREVSEDHANLHADNARSAKKRYINEVDVRVQPFDVVLCCPVLLQGLRVLCSFLEGTGVERLGTKADDEVKHAEDFTFNNGTLPLIYLNTSTVRLFGPVVSTCDGRSFDEEQLKSEPAIDGKRRQRPSERHLVPQTNDLILLQIDGMNVSPQVDNPLFRIVLRNDLYNLAQQAHITNVPGSEIEDRQYQVDITGISLVSGSWDELVCASGSGAQPTFSSKLHTMGENPALEWNNKRLTSFDDNGDDDFLPQFLPLVSPFDFRVIVAPAVLYNQSAECSKQEIICGHSFELNVTTDLDFYLNLQQMSLLSKVYATNLSHLLTEVHESKRTNDANGPLNAQSINKNKFETKLDSGIESEMSTFKTAIDSPSCHHALKETLSAKRHTKLTSSAIPVFNPKHPKFIPYEILLTSGHISFSLYDVKDTKDASVDPSSKSRRNGSRKKRTRHREHRFSDPTVWSSVDEKEDAIPKVDHSCSSSPSHQDDENKESSSSHKFKRTKSASLGTDGYEGSEESIDESGDVNYDKNLEKNPRIQPLFYFKFIQPHTFLKCLELTQKLELSCFDISVRAGTEKHQIHLTEVKMLPSSEDFVSHWLETKPGNVNSKTGIPPAFLTLAVTNFFDLPADFKLKIERPMRLGFSISRYDMFVNTCQSVTSFLRPASYDRAEEATRMSDSLEMRIGNFRSFIRNVRQIDFSTVQLNVILETFSHKENAHLLLNMSHLSGNLSLKSGKEAVVDEVLIGLHLKEYLLKTSYNNKAVAFCGPSSAKIGAFVKWEDWSLCDPLPHLCCNVEHETLMCNVGIENLLCWKLILEDLCKISNEDATSKTVRKTDTCNLDRAKENPAPFNRSWHDDLRIGTFQYIQDADDAGLQPGPYEIIFYREQAGRPASMTWCYPEPRILTRVEVYPVPFRAASDVMDQLTCETKEEVTCVLQYWDSLVMNFITYQKFQLSEVQHCVLELPSVGGGGAGEQLVIANKWRVVLDYIDDESLAETAHRSLVSPLALAACMRVDSYFDPTLIPSFQLRANVDMINFVLSNHVQHSGKVPLNLQPFVPDGSMPNKQDFLSISFENILFHGNYGNGTLQTQLDSSMKMDVVEYCNLTIIPLMDLCGIQNRTTVVVDKMKALTVLEIATTLNPIVLRISQSAIHTLGVGYHLWHQNLMKEKENEQIFMNYYAICNDTQETIRFGQVDMHENVILRSREMHTYSWRTHKSKQLLHVCVEGMHWKWCEPFNIDTVGTIVRHMEHKEQNATLIILIKSLNSIQKQVLIRGPLHVMNFLNYPLEVKFCTALQSSKSKTTREHRVQLAAENTIATSIMEPNVLKFLQVQMKNGNDRWSKEVTYNVKENSNGILVQIPMTDSDHMINAWCHFVQQSLSKSAQLFIIFAPMFIVQTNLPRNLNLKVTVPGLPETYSVEIEGKGKEHQLHFPGNPESTHHLSFQISPELEPSKPEFPISMNTISEVFHGKLQSPFDVEDFYRSSLCLHSLDWPYDQDNDLANKLGELPPASIEHILKSLTSATSMYEGAEQPNINLEVHLQQKWPYCNSLLISVKPCAIIINQTLTDVCIKLEDQEWKIGSKKIFASPKLEGFMQVGVQLGEKCYYSENLQLTNDDWTFRDRWPRSHNKLPKQGFSQVPIFIDEGAKKAMCYLTMNFKLKDEMLIIQIQPSYSIINNSSHGLKLAPIVIGNTEEKIGSLPENSYQVKLADSRQDDDDVSCKNIVLWEIVHSKPTEDEIASEHSLYISICSFQVGQSADHWSLPCRVENGSRDSRFTILIPKCEDAASHELSDLAKTVTIPLTVSMHELKGVFYFVIGDDLHPQVLLYNSCSIPLYFGESLQNVTEEFGIMEEMNTIQKLPCVLPGQACHYSFPSTMNKFPELSDLDSSPKLRFANVIPGDGSCFGDGEAYLHWSSQLDVAVENDVFLNIPNYSDVRVHLEKVGHTTHVFVEPVSRIEISAKEIRSRIKSKVQTHSPVCFIKTPAKETGAQLQCKLNRQADPSPSVENDGHVPPSKTTVEAAEEEEVENAIGTKQSSSSSQAKREKNDVLVFSTFFVRHCSLIAIDTLTKRNRFQEVVRINIDDLACSLRPRTENKISKIKRNLKQELVLCVGCVQVDNQLMREENFDFPVMLVPQDKKDGSSASNIVRMPELLTHSVRSDAFISADMLVEIDTHKSLCIQNVSISVKPVLLYVEDAFLYKLMKILPTFSTTQMCNSRFASSQSDTRLPLEILDRIYAYHHPIQIQHLKIESLSMMLSLHASLKLFISLDHTPLVFKSFERSNILTVSYPVGRALTVHYLSGALFRAGWVVGSLDLLGNPGGFARAVSSGMVDFVRLPYQGLMRGPWAFLTGIAHGSTSLVQQITAGTLVSITNLASSVSRNMEKLSLDDAYRQQNEEIRRSKPDSVTQGFTQGLTGFGISLLGAVAGIIDQPLQTFHQSGGRSSFPVGAVTGLISGVSKGIVGIVTKPLGGAAELVSQAGQGILYGTGWNKLLEIRYNPTNEGDDTLSNSQLKYAWKMLSDLPGTDIVLSVEATQIIQSGNYIASVLLLTTHVLFIVNIEEDTQQQAFTLSEVECAGIGSDPTLIYVTPLNTKPVLSSSPPEEKQTRVEEFVSKTVKYLLQGPEESERSESSSRDSPVIATNNASMHFHVNPNMRNMFLALFKVVRNNMINRGFKV